MGRVSLPQPGGRAADAGELDSGEAGAGSDGRSRPSTRPSVSDSSQDPRARCGATSVAVDLGRHHSRLARQAPHQGLELVAESRHRLEAIPRRLRERAVEHRLQRGQRPRVRLDERPGRRVDDGVQHLDRVAPAKRRLAGDHLVEHDAEAEHVAPVIGLLSGRLLGRAVAHRAVRDADLGERVVRARRGARPGVGALAHQHLGQAEVQDLGLAPRAHDDVRGLEVAVHDAAGVGDRECVGQLDRDRERGKRLERAAAHELLERRALDVLQHDVVEAVGLPDVVDGLDVGVVEDRAQRRLALEAPPGRLARRRVGTQRLDHDHAAEAHVERLERRGLAALAQRLEDPIVRERAAGAEGCHRDARPL